MRLQYSMIIFGYGNPSRGDDALGPALLARLAQQPKKGTGIARLALVEAIQLQLEHALELFGQDLVLFIDASISGPVPFGFHRLAAEQDTSFTTHALSPAELLHVYEQIGQGRAPPSYQLSVRGEDFSLGAPLSAPAKRHLEEAYAFVRMLCAVPQAVAWERHVDENAT